MQLYNSLDTNLSPRNKLELWLQEIRSIVSERILNEEERVPSITSLWRHWLQSSWVSKLWQNSSKDDIFTSLPPPEESGWLKATDGYKIDWEAPEVERKVQASIDFSTKGYSCKKGCKTASCGCRKKERHCGPACLCQGCLNLQSIVCDDINPSIAGENDSEEDTSQETTDKSTSDEQCVEEEIITEPFDECYDIV